jgi:hypothetical protein
MVESKSSRRGAFGTYVRDHLASILAILVSVVSLGVALSSNRTQERLLAASSWPTLEAGSGNRSDEGTDEITLILGNNGVGPARLRGVRDNGEFAGDSRRLLKQCCGAGDNTINDVTSGTRGRVLKAGDQIVLMTLPKETNSDELWKRFDRARFDVTVQACYCSVLDDAGFSTPRRWILSRCGPAPRSRPKRNGTVDARLMSIWSRIKEHKVLQWTLGYAAAAYTLLHGVEMVGNAFTWPHAVVRLVPLLLILGVPIAAPLAWYHGHKGHQRVGRREIAVLGCSSCWRLASLVLRAPHGTPTAKRNDCRGRTRAGGGIKSLAVLPFDNRSATRASFYADGLTDELTTASRESRAQGDRQQLDGALRGADKRPSRSRATSASRAS